MNTSKIKSIKKVKCKSTDIYDITVPKYNNFILANGLVVHNCKPYQSFKSAIYEKRFEVFDDELLNQEVTELERSIETGKVDHPEGGSKDKSDAVCGALYTASKHAEEFAYDYGESAEELLRVNEGSSASDIEQLNKDLEDQLKGMSNVFNMIQNQNKKRVHPSDLDKGTTDYYMYDDIIIM